MKRRAFLRVLAGAATAFLGLLDGVSAAKETRPAPKPNIILIFVDDMGYGDLGCYGNPTNKTPNIDRLAAAGQRWTSFYSSGATCVPSRRGLMTGRHPALMGRVNWVDIRNQLIPAMLKKQGYTTAILGKWHLAGYPKDLRRVRCIRWNADSIPITARQAATTCQRQRARDRPGPFLTPATNSLSRSH